MLQRVTDHCFREMMKVTTGRVATCAWFVLLFVLYPFAWVEHQVRPRTYDEH